MTITFLADGLQHRERPHSLFYLASEVEIPAAVEANYKPVVTIILAVIPIAAGVRSSRRRRWKGGKDGMAVVKAFMLTSMPSVLAEAATGVVSFSTGQLSMPPTMGLGTAVDVVILLAGLVVAIVRALKAGESKSER